MLSWNFRALVAISACLLTAASSASLIAAEGPVRRPRLRLFDVLHIRAELAIEPQQGRLSGTVYHKLQPLHEGFCRIELDCDQLDVREVTHAGRRQKHLQQDGKLRIELDQVYSTADTLEIAIAYSGQPKKGMFFIRPDPFYPQKPLTVWTQGEAELTHFWLPCYDYPNDLATSEMIVTVPAGLFVLSNGTLLEKREQSADLLKSPSAVPAPSGEAAPAAVDRVTYHWKMDQPHASYLISIVVGDLVPYETELRGLKITSYAARSQFDPETMKRSYGRTPEMLRLFERLIGVPYPWPKYAQVTVPEFRWGGMENISATTLNEYALRDAATEGESSIDGLIAHELAHQWWGDLLTCRDWSHLWLNEGFATYFDALFTAEHRGPAAFAFQMEGNQRAAIGVDADKPRPMVWDRYDSPMEMFDARAYPKGASVLHMLRGYLGDDVFFRSLSNYAKKHRHQPVETADLQRVLEQTSNKKLDWFFKQWCYQAGAPKLEVAWRWNREDSTARVSIRQTQKTSNLVPIFRLPTTIEFVRDGKSQSFPIEIDGPQHEFVFRHEHEPELVFLDPARFLLAEIKFQKSPAEWERQFREASLAIQKAEAIRALADLPAVDARTQMLIEAIDQEAAEQLRAEMVKALGKWKGKAAQEAILAATQDRHAVVRKAAIEQLEHFEGKDIEAALVGRWQAETAPQARAAVLRIAAKKKAPGWEEMIAQGIRQPSARGTVGRAALEWLAEHDHPQQRELIVWSSERGVDEYLRTAAIKALAKLAKTEPDAETRLEAFCRDPNYFVRREAYSALASIGGERQAKFLLDLAKATTDADESRDLKKKAEAIQKPKPDPLAPALELEKKAAELEAQAKRMKAEAALLRMKK